MICCTTNHRGASDSGLGGGMGAGCKCQRNATNRHLQIQLIDDLPHSKSPFELLSYETRPRGFVALDLATVLVEAKL